MSADAALSEFDVLEDCNRLVDLGAWEQTKIDPEGWLSNFSETERPFALLLLSRFTFLSDNIVDQLFRSAFHSLSNILFEGDWLDFDEACNRWRKFCSQAIITVVEGENPNPSDSGLLFARKARQAIGISHDQLVLPQEALAKLTVGFAGPVVFVDDFVGSGEQFLKTWQRSYSCPEKRTSFKLIASSSSAKFYYCNAMTTAYGLRRINKSVPQVTVSAGNVISEWHSLIDPQSLLWPTAMRIEGIDFIRTVSQRLGFSDENGGEDDWRGFHKLALAIAFEHSVPDANLPLFYTDRNGWKPLVRRL